ncbi:uncharacterized protein LOC129232152 [Uloborus diversus]|uniref:uncharacterized protein LOC129232152 n=1 Tax=Uloborus diversus TaxID=327109 RepID=UPI00240940EB|nr:uncharacterized protein LOC129232152 [Uloborus diversus]
MKFHCIHGSNVSVDEGGRRAQRIRSFCDGIAFSHKPLSPNARLSLLLGAHEEWTGALRIGVTTQDPSTYFAHRKLPRYACPDLTSRTGFWARPLPEAWAANGNRLTFYVNSKGQFHFFVNSEHKGAILVGLPIKEQLWVLVDLYGITVSVKFVSNSGSAPSEVVARGPEAVQAYQSALSSGSTSYYHTRIALIGPPDGKKTLLKKLLVKTCDDLDAECDGIDTTCMCQTTEDSSSGEAWTLVRLKNSCGDEMNNNSEEQNVDDSEKEEKKDDPPMVVISADDEFFKAIACNVVKEMILQKKKTKEDQKKGSKSAFRLQSSIAKGGSSKVAKEEISKDSVNFLSSNGEMLSDLPKRVVDLVESMLKESENKSFWEKKENEKHDVEGAPITFSIWNYSGHSKYLMLHQLFLSPQTIYLFVFDLSQDLDAPIENSEDFEFPGQSKLSYLSLLHTWLEMIYVSVAHPKNETKNQAEENVINDIICTLFPPVLIVGVQEDSTTFDSLVEHQFNKIKESIQDKVYYHLVHSTFFYVGTPETVAVDSMLMELRKKIQEFALQLPHVGAEIPLKWMLFSQAVDRLIEREVYFANINKLAEVARLENIESDEEFFSMIHFFHHQGKIWFLGCDRLQINNEENCGIVILKPQWLINYIYQIMCSETLQILKKNKCVENEENDDVFSWKHFEALWPNALHHTAILLHILDSTDVLCEVVTDQTDNQASLTRKYAVPWLNESSDFICEEPTNENLILVLDFSNLLPVGFFTKLTVRLSRWSKQHNWKRNLNQNCGADEIPVDYNHFMKLRKICYHRIQVVVVQNKYFEDAEGIKMCYPAPHVCLKVRHLLERETEHLRDVWFKRISYSINVLCPCEKVCKLHEIPKCGDLQCIHLLPLNECLTKKVFECDYRSVKTDFVQKFFNSSVSPQYSESMRLSMEYISTSLMGNFFWTEHDISREEPSWLKHVGNMLTSVSTGQDWIALAKRLGYSEREIRRMEDENVPSVTLLNSWINSNGRTRYCIDLLVTCLEQMNRRDVADWILKELGPELPSPPVFISYQWESQLAVLDLRRRLELAGYPCWMDVGHIMGGDALYGKIYEGINKAKVVLCFLTPRYVLSPLCTREMSLADILRKPIVPVMLEPTPWPPPGALALILSSLVYIDLCGIGGHGGSGRQADWESRFRSIVERLSHFISPSFSPQLTSISSERLIPPPTAPDAQAQEEADLSNDVDNREISIDPEIPDEDTLSESASTRDPTSPVVWDPARRNRVVRCSVCIII